MKLVKVSEILNLDKKLTVIVGEDEKLKMRIERAFRTIRPDVIVLRNPENNLHPEKHCELIEGIAIWAHDEKHVVITNSPYITDHLINLMKAAKSKRQGEIKEKFKLKTTAAFIRVKDVSVFNCEDGKITDILKRNGDIDWNTFSKVSDWVTDLYFDIYDN